MPLRARSPAHAHVIFLNNKPKPLFLSFDLTLFSGGNENNFDKFKYFYDIPEGWTADTVNKVRVSLLPLFCFIFFFILVKLTHANPINHAALQPDGEVYERDR